MGMVFVCFAIIAASYLTLRSICMMPESKVQSGSVIAAAGFASWLFILSLASLGILSLYFVYALLVLGDIGSIYGLIFIGLIAGLAVRVNELLDTGTVFFFLRQTALFQPMRPRVSILRDELEKKRIQDIHRLTSEEPFPGGDKEKRLLTKEEIRQYQIEARSLKQRPMRSGRFDEEAKSLKSGLVTSVADPWKVHTFEHKFHDWYDEMSGLVIDPQSRSLRFKLNVPKASGVALRDPVYIFQVKQELYQLLQVLNTDPWLQWYGAHFDSLAATCLGIESDGFGHSQLYPFLKVVITRARLYEREGFFFNPADLHTISELTFNNGNPLPAEPI